jgi:hypothetical protein
MRSAHLLPQPATTRTSRVGNGNRVAVGAFALVDPIGYNVDPDLELIVGARGLLTNPLALPVLSQPGANPLMRRAPRQGEFLTQALRNTEPKQ